MSAPACEVAVDIGGTFTDVVLVAAQGMPVSVKVPTTPDDPARGVLEGVTAVLRRAGVDASAVTRVAHATTLAGNLILEGSGARVAYVTTAGFGDLLHIGRAVREGPDRYDLFHVPPRPPLSRTMVVEAEERIDAQGEVVRAFTAGDAERCAQAVAALHAEAIAVCFLHAYRNPAHELLLGKALRRHCPDAYVALSSQVCPEHREYDRAITTLLCAYVGPVMHGYLSRLEAGLGDIGVRAPLHVMQSSGGVMGVDAVLRRPIACLESGPAAAVTAASVFLAGSRDAGDALSFDMGGTTAKASLLPGGRPALARELGVRVRDAIGREARRGGLPVRIAVVDIAEVGAGGGSIAWVDDGGLLRVGPRSAGSQPGPACYGRGGSEPTVTDANLVLGYLGTQLGRLDTAMQLDVARARTAIETHVATPLGMDVVAAALGIHAVANAAMASAVRLMTVGRGIDSRGLPVVSSGGAAGAHAVAIAEELGLGEVLVPRSAGVLSALGLLCCDVAADAVHTRPMPLPVEPAALRELVDGAVREACDVAALHGDEAAPRVELALDMRYRDQSHDLPVPIDTDVLDIDDGDALAGELTRRFDDVYRAHYGVAPGGPVTLIGVRARAVLAGGGLPAAGPPTARDAAPAATRTLVLAAHGAVEADIYMWELLPPGACLPGPAVIEADDTTVLVPPGWAAAVDARQTLHIRPEAPPDR